MITTEEMDPGIGQAQGEARTALAYSASMAAQQQAEAGRFIREHGHEVVGGHGDVGIAAGSAMWAAGRAPYATDTSAAPE